jgi:predicted nucleotidyltransferase
MEIIGETLDVILDALAEQLRSLGEQAEAVVIGGSALTALGLVKRATRDVDLLAIAEKANFARPSRCRRCCGRRGIALRRTSIWMRTG